MTAVVVARQGVTGCPYRPDPPAAQLVTDRARAVAGLLLFALPAVLVACARDRLTRTVDMPLSQFVLDHRTPAMDVLARQVTSLGGSGFIYPAGVLLGFLALPRCRVLAGMVWASTAARPVIELLAKLSFDRDRPDLSRLVPGNGPSFPSGHVLATALFWGLVPAVVALYARKRAVVRAASVAAVLLFLAIGCSRVYLGVHWPTDVVGGWGLGLALLMVVRLCTAAHHATRPCLSATADRDSRTD
ncbi:MAG: phosphatase PAP2 family protein [Mycobacteriaceae bacterium]|nr:phosphatase PAP2 family protein [Mycobacteriaceae bacterium]